MPLENMMSPVNVCVLNQKAIQSKRWKSARVFIHLQKTRRCTGTAELVLIASDSANCEFRR